MHLRHVIAKMLLSLERLHMAMAWLDGTWEISLRVSFHVTLQVIFAVEDVGGGATCNTTLEDLSWLAAGWDGVDVWTEDHFASDWCIDHVRQLVPDRHGFSARTKCGGWSC